MNIKNTAHRCIIFKLLKPKDKEKNHEDSEKSEGRASIKEIRIRIGKQKSSHKKPCKQGNNSVTSLNC